MWTRTRVKYHIPTDIQTLYNQSVSFLDLDSAAVARALSLISSDSDDVVDAFFERREEIELSPPGEERPRIWREQGLSVRLVRDRESWLAVRDEISSEAFVSALRRVARRLSSGVLRAPRVELSDWPEAVVESDFQSFSARVVSRLRAKHLVFPIRMWLRRHRRWLRVVDREVAAEPETELFYSCRVECDWGRWGTLLPQLDAEAARHVADSLGAAFRARKAEPPSTGFRPILLGSSAAAIFLHEAVAHALEVDTLALGGDPDAAVGVSMGSDRLDLLDDPTSGPAGLRRRTDDEGAPVLRRWLLRRGVVEQPLADRRWAGRSMKLSSGAARRQSRHLGPVPRSLHLELLPGEQSMAELAELARPDALFVPEASRGHLEPRTGEFSLTVPYGRRLSGGELGDRVGSFVIRGKVRSLLGQVIGVGNKSRVGGAGWCAKGGQRMPVWSTTPAVLLEGAEVGL